MSDSSNVNLHDASGQQSVMTPERARRVRRNWTILLAVLIGGGSVGYYATNAPRFQQEQEAADLESKARSVIANKLHDPLAAQFRSIEARNKCVTGEVNGKNLMGAYIGFKRFFYDGMLEQGEIEPSKLALSDQSVQHLKDVLGGADYTFRESDCKSRSDKP